MVTRTLSPVLATIRNRKREFTIHHNNIQVRPLRHIPLWIRRIRNSIFNSDHPKFDHDVDINHELEDTLDLDFLFNFEPEGPKTVIPKL